MENALLTVFRLSLFETFCVTGSLILIGMILGIIENRANFYVQRVFGMERNYAYSLDRHSDPRTRPPADVLPFQAQDK